jgi:outer membrane autotransporter protein
MVEDSFGGAVCATGAAAPHADDCNGMRAWAKVIGSSDHVDATSAGLAFTNKGAGALGGIEKGWTGGLTLGVALGYTENDLRISAAPASASGRSYYASLYGRWSQGPLQLDGQGFWMKSDWPLRRVIAGYGTAESNPNGDSEGFLVQASTPLGSSGFRPYVRFIHAHFGRDATTETGVGMLGFQVDGGGADASLGEAGMIYQPTSVPLGSARVFPTLRLGIQQDFAGRSIPIRASLAGVSGSDFTSAYVKPGRTTGVADAGIKAQLTSSFDLTGDIRGRFGSGQSEGAATLGGVIHF